MQESLSTSSKRKTQLLSKLPTISWRSTLNLNQAWPSLKASIPSLSAPPLLMKLKPRAVHGNQAGTSLTLPTLMREVPFLTTLNSNSMTKTSVLSSLLFKTGSQELETTKALLSIRLLSNTLVMRKRLSLTPWDFSSTTLVISINHSTPPQELTANTPRVTLAATSSTFLPRMKQRTFTQFGTPLSTLTLTLLQWYDSLYLITCVAFLFQRLEQARLCRLFHDLQEQHRSLWVRKHRC